MKAQSCIEVVVDDVHELIYILHEISSLSPIKWIYI